MAKWSKVSKGDRIEVRGREYEVIKIKPKGKHAKVTAKGAGHVFEGKVALADKVKIVPDPLHDESGAQRRWAKPNEVKHSLKVGDPTAVKPPQNKAQRSTDPWESRRDKVERRLDELLGAHLVGEATDEDAGYYVPPVDITTIAAHLALFHAVKVDEYGIDDMLDLHDLEHRQLVESGIPLAVNHWHTETRPAVA